MSQCVYPSETYEVVCCSPEVLVDALMPTLDAEMMKRMLESQRETAHRRPNPANGAPKPAGYNPVA